LLKILLVIVLVLYITGGAKQLDTNTFERYFGDGKVVIK
jgi:hypothetical protein